jgi:hypothetical protein
MKYESNPDLHAAILDAAQSTKEHVQQNVVVSDYELNNTVAPTNPQA